jgi:3',5'-cyclic AMP phosphodiesterase CpdA
MHCSNDDRRKLITRREAIRSLGAFAATAYLRPAAAFASPVNDRVRFAVIGDWGTGESDQDAIARQMMETYRRAPFDFVLTAGDNIYPSGSGRDFIKKFEQPFTALLRERVNFYAALGNHDIREGRRDQCQYPLFNMGGHCYYSLRRGEGLAEFFMLDSTDFDRAQTDWLEQALRASTAKWKIAVFHHPLYSSGKRHGHDLKLRRLLEPLFQRHQVNVAFSGHDHIYERSKPQHGIHYFVTGAGGKIRRGGVNLKSPTREVSYDQDNHFMLIELDDRQLRFQSLSETGLLIDRGAIERATTPS